MNERFTERQLKELYTTLAAAGLAFQVPVPIEGQVWSDINEALFNHLATIAVVMQGLAVDTDFDLSPWTLVSPQKKGTNTLRPFTARNWPPYKVTQKELVKLSKHFDHPKYDRPLLWIRKPPPSYPPTMH